MSDSKYSKVCCGRQVHDVVDKAWAEDCLSDDDLEVPEGDVFEEGARRRGSTLYARVPPALDDDRQIFATLDGLPRDDHSFTHQDR